MASTRPKNLLPEYRQEQRSLGHAQKYVEYVHGAAGSPVRPAFPSIGPTPSHFGWNNLSYNPVEIESSLWGINANNLVSPQPKVEPHLKTIQFRKFFDPPPLIMPKPLVPLPQQRPFVVPQ